MKKTSLLVALLMVVVLGATAYAAQTVRKETRDGVTYTYGGLWASASYTMEVKSGPMTKVLSPEEMVEWRERDPEDFLEWKKSHTEEYSAWLVENPQYAE